MDVVHGRIAIKAAEDREQIFWDDPVLLKSDGIPTYHLANVVDDHHMQISHVIRGEEWIPSTPHHVAIYNALGWPLPSFIHIPLLTNTAGQKLSKRDQSTSVSAFRQQGYAPVAVLNYLALYGWSSRASSGASEVHTLEDLQKLFSLDGLTKGRIAVTPEKLKFLSKEHLRRQIEDPCRNSQLLESYNKGMQETLSTLVAQDDLHLLNDMEYLQAVLQLVSERMTVQQDFYTQAHYFYVDPSVKASNELERMDPFI